MSSLAVAATSFQLEQDYAVDVVDRVWLSAQSVPGNDPALWRKDGRCAWIHRPSYRDRYNEFGWEIADCAYTQRNFGVAALRPMQWPNHVDFLTASKHSLVMADGLRNARWVVWKSHLGGRSTRTHGQVRRVIEAYNEGNAALALN